MCILAHAHKPSLSRGLTCGVQPRAAALACTACLHHLPHMHLEFVRFICRDCKSEKAGCGANCACLRSASRICIPLVDCATLPQMLVGRCPRPSDDHQVDVSLVSGGQGCAQGVGQGQRLYPQGSVLHVPKVPSHPPDAWPLTHQLLWARSAWIGTACYARRQPRPLPNPILLTARNLAAGQT